MKNQTLNRNVCSWEILVYNQTKPLQKRDYMIVKTLKSEMMVLPIILHGSSVEHIYKIELTLPAIFIIGMANRAINLQTSTVLNNDTVGSLGLKLDGK